MIFQSEPEFKSDESWNLRIVFRVLGRVLQGKHVVVRGAIPETLPKHLKTSLGLELNLGTTTRSVPKRRLTVTAEYYVFNECSVRTKT